MSEIQNKAARTEIMLSAVNLSLDAEALAGIVDTIHITKRVLEAMENAYRMGLRDGMKKPCAHCEDPDSHE